MENKIGISKPRRLEGLLSYSYFLASSDHLEFFEKAQVMELIGLTIKGIQIMLKLGRINV